MSLQVFKDAVEKWGIQNQLNKTIEECAELITAIQHWRVGKASDLAMIEECADVFIMMSQMKSYFGDNFEQIYDSKIEKLKNKIAANNDE